MGRLRTLEPLKSVLVVVRLGVLQKPSRHQPKATNRCESRIDRLERTFSRMSVGIASVSLE